MDASSATITGLTAAVVLVTSYYAWQTRQTVDELRKARAVAVLPHLALRLHDRAPTISFVQVINVGPGPALDVDVELSFIPGSDATEPVESRIIRTPVMVSGESHHALPMLPGQGVMDTAALTAQFERIELRGTMRDALGTAHVVEETLADLEEWRASRAAAHLLWTDPDPERRLASELGKQLDRVAKTLTDAWRGPR